MNNVKFLKSILLILLIVNIVTIGFIWITKPPRISGNETAASYLSNELSFNAKQEEQFEDLQSSFLEKREDLRHENKENFDLYFELLQNPKVDSASVKKAANAIISIKEKEEIALFYHFQKVRALCNESQKQKFDQIIKEAARMMGPPPRGDRQGTPPPPPGMGDGQGPPPRCDRHDMPPPPPNSMGKQCSPPPKN
jgi:protein CpxP